MIEAAAERQTEYVRKCRIGEYATLADRLLYEIEEAKLCLLNPRLRKDYDEKLAEEKPTPTKKRILPPPSTPVGEGNEIIRTYFGVVSIILAAFIIMAVVTFMLPWQRVVFSKSSKEPDAAKAGVPPAGNQAAAGAAANVAVPPQKPNPAAQVRNAANPIQPGVLAAKGVPPILDRDEMRFKEQVRDATRRAQTFLVGIQNNDGSFDPHWRGVTSLALFALLNSGMSRDDPAIARGLHLLRESPLPDSAYEVYQASTMLLALVSAHDWERDRTQIEHLAQKIQDCQTTKGTYAGTWNYGRGKSSGTHEDNCNTGFAIAGLHAATEVGVRIQRSTWQLTADHLVQRQNDDGGWGYRKRQPQHREHDLFCDCLAAELFASSRLSECRCNIDLSQAQSV